MTGAVLPAGYRARHYLLGYREHLPGWHVGGRIQLVYADDRDRRHAVYLPGGWLFDDQLQPGGGL